MRFSEMLRRRSRSLAVVAAAVLIGAGGSLVVPVGDGFPAAGAAPANTYTVSSIADDGSPGTLRWAMTEANNSPGDDLIEITAVGVITLTAQLPVTSDTVTIDGPGMDVLTIDGDGNRFFWLQMSRGSTTSLTVADVTLTGSPNAVGGLLFKSHGHATFDRVRITGTPGGPSIQNKDGGTLTITDSIITANTGTVVFSDHGNTPNDTTVDTDYQNRTYISNTWVTNNSGGCAVWTERFVRVTDSSFTDNADAALCIGGLNRSYVSDTLIARNAGDGLRMASWGNSVVQQNAILVDGVAVYDNGGAGITAGFATAAGPRASMDTLISNSVIFGNGVDISGTIYEADPQNLRDNTIGIPRPPGSVTGVARDGSVAVSWQAPTSDSGSPVSGYTATASPGGAVCTAATTSCVVPGLTNGTPYTFEVVATNARGDSWASAASAPVVPDPSVPVPTTAPPTTAPRTTAPPTTAPVTTLPAPVEADAPAPTSPPAARILAALPMGLDVPSEVRPGQTVTVTGTGFEPGERVQIIMMSEPVVLAEVIADGTGTAVASVTIPLAAATGEHHLYMFGLTSRTGIGGATKVVREAATPNSADVRPGSLAFTGAATAELLALGVVLSLLGLSLRYGGVRRRPTR